MHVVLCMTSNLIEAAIYEHTYPPNPSCGGQARTQNNATSTGLRKYYIQSNCACSVTVRFLTSRTTSRASGFETHYGPPHFIFQGFLSASTEHRSHPTNMYLFIARFLTHARPGHTCINFCCMYMNINIAPAGSRFLRSVNVELRRRSSSPEHDAARDSVPSPRRAYMVRRVYQSEIVMLKRTCCFG